MDDKTLRGLWLGLFVVAACAGGTPAPTSEPALDAEALAVTDPDDILVDLADTATPDAIERELGLDLVLVDSSGVAERTQLYRAHVDPAQRDAILARLAARSDVEIAEPDAYAQLSPSFEVRVPVVDVAEPGFPNDPQYKYQWHLDQIGMKEAWKMADGNGVVVAVLDTGVGFEDHKKFHLLPDLKGIEFVKPFDFVGNTQHANDDHGHGSHVTGTIAQMTNNGIGVAGVARNVKIMPLKVLSASGSGSVAGIADAIRFAADNGAKVINMSLGGAFPSKVLKKAVEYAHRKGVTVVCAAGNDGRGKVGYPAAYPGAIAVSATQFDETITFYSNYGKDIDIAAPGGNTRVDQNNDGKPDGVLQNTIALSDPTKDDYFAYMGTSMASPHVAGVAALVVGEGVTDPDKVEEVLEKSARKPNNQTYTEDKYGAGIVDAPAAIALARKVKQADTTLYAACERDLASSSGLPIGVAQLILGLLLAGGVAASARQRGLGARPGAGYLAGVVAGIAAITVVPAVVPVLTTLPVLSTALFASAGLPLALLALGFGAARARAPLAGVSVGVAAQLACFAVASAIPVPGSDTVWLAGNAVASLLLARLALRR